MLKYLGDYVNGIDTKNLNIAIFKGNVVIENVSIKPEVLDRIELPIKLLFSSIGKLSLTVPWKSLGSQPVEILLENLFIVLQLKDEKEWKF